jgi:hypothetical protein
MLIAVHPCSSAWVSCCLILGFCSAAGAAAHSSNAIDPETLKLAMTELDLLHKPEYVHVVLNHLPIYGTILAAIALAISLESSEAELPGLRRWSSR